MLGRDDATGDDKMHSVKRLIPAATSATSDIGALRDSVRVLAEVIAQLSERIEVLETRDSLRAFRPAEG